MVVAVASPSPAPAAAAGCPHPTYKEMIVQALTELRGSSGRRAIAKYIADHFSGLPARHDALLSVHLRRLRSQGVLLVSGYTYLLSSAAPQQRRHRGPGRPPKMIPSAASASASAPPGLGPKRGPGRPRKNAALPAASVSVPVSGAKRRPGRPGKNTIPVASSSVALPGGKRGPGRPPKYAASAIVPRPQLGVLVPLPQPGVKRGPGRSPNNATPVAVLPTAVLGAKPQPGVVVTSPLPGVKVKRGPGRPPKNATPVAVLPTAVLGAKRGRGRPPKSAPMMSAVPRAEAPGRPQKDAISTAVVPGGKGRPGRRKVGATAASRPNGTRRPGRPRKTVMIMADVQSSLENIVASTGVSGVKRGPGRPRRAMLPAHSSNAAPATAMPLLVAGKRKRGQTIKEKRSVGQPIKDVLQSGYSLSGDVALTKRGPGRPRKEKKPEVQPSKTGGTVSAKKRGRGRPRKEKPLEKDLAETGGAAVVDKLGRGRPRKDKQSASGSVETENLASMGNKRGRGRPRKDKASENGSAQAAGEVSNAFPEARPEKNKNLVLGEKTQAEDVVLEERKETRPADVGGVFISGENVTAALVEDGDAMSGEKTGDDHMNSNIGTADCSSKKSANLQV